MKSNQKIYQNREKDNNHKHKEKNEADKWKLSMREVLKGACLINGDGSLVQYKMKPK